MREDFSKKCGVFELEGWYSGFPHFHHLFHHSWGVRIEIRSIQIDDLKDLKYLIDRAIEHHDQHGHKQ